MYLKEARLQANMKSKEVAALLNITPATYSRYESGKIQPDPATLVELSRIFNTSVDRLLGKFDLQMFSDTPQAKAANIAGKILATKDEQKIKLTLEALEKISKMSSDQLEALNIFLSTIK